MLTVHYRLSPSSVSSSTEMRLDEVDLGSGVLLVCGTLADKSVGIGIVNIRFNEVAPCSSIPIVVVTSGNALIIFSIVDVRLDKIGPGSCIPVAALRWSRGSLSIVDVRLHKVGPSFCIPADASGSDDSFIYCPKSASTLILKHECGSAGEDTDKQERPTQS
jgi:hypothetical protein